MNNVIVTVGSVTYAIKLKKLLAREGIQSKLVKIEDTKRKLGCTHGVEIARGDFLSAVVIMRENRVNYTIYEK